MVAAAAVLYSTASANRAAIDPAPARIIAIGDIHGDADAFRAILKQTGLIDNQGGWTGGATTLVQTGDLMDRGPKVREAMELLMALESRARASGGRVVTLVGNHEAMNAIGEWRDVTPAIYASFADDKSEQRRTDAYAALVKLNADRKAQLKGDGMYQTPERDTWMAVHPPGSIEYAEAMGPDGRYGKWIRSKDAVAQFGSTIFLHGGIKPDLPQGSVEALNAKARDEISTIDRVRRLLVARKLILPFFTLQEVVEAVRLELGAVSQALSLDASAAQNGGQVGAGLIRDELFELNTLQTEIGSWYVINPDGPLWFRDYTSWTHEDGMAQMAKVLARYHAAHIVVGHTVTNTHRIKERFAGAVFLIDTGMLSSLYKGGRASALEIRGNVFTALYLDTQEVLFRP